MRDKLTVSVSEVIGIGWRENYFSLLALFGGDQERSEYDFQRKKAEGRSDKKPFGKTIRHSLSGNPVVQEPDIRIQ